MATPATISRPTEAPVNHRVRQKEATSSGSWKISI